MRSGTAPRRRVDPKALALALLVLGGGSGGLTGCAGLKDLARAAFQEPKLTFRNATVDVLDLEGATVALHVELQNPNGFGLDVARVGWTFDAEGTRVATGDMPGGLAIPANGTAPLAIPVRVRWHDVPGIAGLFKRGEDGLAYKVAGTVGVRTPIGVIDLPVSHSDRLTLPKLPSFSLTGLKVRSVSLTDVEFEVRVAVKNPNAFPVPAGKVAWTLALGGGAPVARADGAALAPIGAHDTGSLVVPVRLDLASAGRTALDVARGAEVRVRLAGEAELAGLPVPLDLDAVLPARR
jgi:LEA14-like dessication related protein